MEWMNFVTGLVTVVLGTGWLFTYRAYKKKNEGEATQSEAGGWEAQQHVYQNTISDLEKSCEFIRQDRDILRKENEELRKENMELRKKMGELEDTILQLKEDIARNGRRIKALECASKSKKKNKE